MFNDFLEIKLIYERLGFSITNIRHHEESNEYSACGFLLNKNKIEFRTGKITPTKPGHFVAIWKRDNAGKTTPFDLSDGIDFMVITVREKKHLGQFIFPKSILADQGIITQNDKEGKRGMRIYPPWSKNLNKQAQKTQKWQGDYFLHLNSENLIPAQIKKMLSRE
jgi:hypothetical protein